MWPVFSLENNLALVPFPRVISRSFLMSHMLAYYMHKIIISSVITSRLKQRILTCHLVTRANHSRAEPVSCLGHNWPQMSSRYQPTPEQLTMAQAKKAERLKKKQEKKKENATIATCSIIQRPWLTIPSPQDRLKVKVLTWNVSRRPNSPYHY